jgi:hypothetical protein
VIAEHEGHDRQDLELPGQQLKLLEDATIAGNNWFSVSSQFTGQIHHNGLSLYVQRYSESSQYNIYR